MINQESIRAVEAASFSASFCKPLYDSFCFSRIPATIRALLQGVEGGLPSSCIQKGPYDQVIVLFLDAFGWKFFKRHEDHPFLARFAKNGIVSQVTSQFPSTTAAHVTTMHTGLEVGQSGIYEWFQYEPLVDRMIAPLLFGYAGEEGSNSLLAAEIPPAQFFPFKTLYETMHEEGIEPFLVQESKIHESPYSQALLRGAHKASFLRFSQGLNTLGEIVLGPKGKKRYLFFYHAAMDSIMHREGPDALASSRVAVHILDKLEKEFMPKLSRQKNTALLVTADHGMASVFPDKTIYINLAIPEIVHWIKVSQSGYPLVPAGSCRDFFLHIKEADLEMACKTLSSHLKGKAEVFKVEELIKLGFFGITSPRFLERVGNLVILPYLGEAVWWFEKHKFHQNFYGAHGGLTREEMETIFLFLKV